MGGGLIEGDLKVTAETVGSAVQALVPAGANLILDLSDYVEEERDAICAAAVTSLMALKRQAGRHLLVVCDEVQMLAPQGGSGGDSLGALTDLALRGRKRGFGLVISTQRLALVNKNLLAMCSNRLFGLTTLGNDLKRAAEELGFSARERGRLKNLAPGEFFAFGPAISQEVLKVKSAPVRSTHPTPGSIIPPTPPAAKALSQLLAKLSVASKERLEPEPVASPLPSTELKTWVDAAVAARLKTEVNAEVAAALERMRKDHAGEIEGWRAQVEALSQRLEHIHTLSGAVDSEASASPSPAESTPPLPNDDLSAELAEPLASAEADWAEPRAPTPVDSDPETLSAKERRLLGTLASLHHLGLREVAREVAAPLSKQSHRSSAYTALVTDLHKRGLLSYPTPGQLALTPEDRAAATPAAKPVSDAELQAAWLGQLEAYEETLAKELLRAYPKALSRDELSVLSGYSSASSRFAAAVTKLRKFGLADYPATGMVAAGTNFFLRPRELS